jgi:hypothetical protein
VDFLQYNESVRLLACRQSYKGDLIAVAQSIVDHNDTLIICDTDSKDNALNPLLARNYLHRDKNAAPKKGYRRRQDIYYWLCDPITASCS